MDEGVKRKVDTFFAKWKQQVYKKGEILIRADEDPSGIFYLTEGLVRQYTISRSGEEVVLNIYKPSAFFPMLWAMTRVHNMYFFEALNSVTIRKAPKDQALEFIKQEPDVLYDLLRRVYIGIDGLLTRMTYLMTGNAYEQLIIELLLHAQRFGIKKNGFIEVQNVTEREFASHSGMTRETISRELKKLKEKGIVTFSKNNLIIENIEDLESELVS